MTGTLAQLITLVTHGNLYLRTNSIEAHFDQKNTSFQFCNQIDFRELNQTIDENQFEETIIAASPLAWFKYLQEDGCQRLALYYQSSKDQSLAKDHQLAGMVGGGGTWLIEAIYENYSNYWANRWEVTQPDDPDHNIWTVSYGRTAKHQGIAHQQIDQQEMKIQFEISLRKIADFAFEQDLKNWGDVFERALAILENDQPQEKYYHKSLIPINSYPLHAKQLLFAAGSAWVFGGMGSWNDLGFATKGANETYEQLSGLLYQNINEAIIAVTNE